VHDVGEKLAATPTTMQRSGGMKLNQVAASNEALQQSAGPASCSSGVMSFRSNKTLGAGIWLGEPYQRASNQGCVMRPKGAIMAEEQNRDMNKGALALETPPVSTLTASAQEKSNL
jgi:hypothetical protein